MAAIATSMKRTAALVLSVSLGVLGLPPPAGAVFPGRNGRLTFTSWSRVWTARADGSEMTGMRNLFPHNKRSYYSPDWQAR